MNKLRWHCADFSLNATCTFPESLTSCKTTCEKEGAWGKAGLEGHPEDRTGGHPEDRAGGTPREQGWGDTQNRMGGTPREQGWQGWEDTRGGGRSRLQDGDFCFARTAFTENPVVHVNHGGGPPSTRTSGLWSPGRSPLKTDHIPRLLVGLMPVGKSMADFGEYFENRKQKAT